MLLDQSFLLGVIVGGFVVAGIVARLVSRPRELRGLPRLEAKLDALLKHEGIRFDPYADAPPPVLDALHRGEKIEAIKAYRVATGAGLQEAKDYIEELQRRAAPRT